MIKVDITYPDYESIHDSTVYTSMVSLYSFQEIYDCFMEIENPCSCLENIRLAFFKNLNGIQENRIDL